VRRRQAGEPVAYLAGSAGFFGRTFAVNADVLVPRPESEELIERAIARVRSLHARAPTLCDVGTGSGILAITAACELPALRCTAIDVSPAALAVARANARMHGVEARIEFLCGDLLAPAGARRFDTVVANLPYVEAAALAPAPDPTSFEPRMALDGGTDGLDLYRRLLERLNAHLNPGGAAFLEAGEHSTAALATLAASAFPNAEVRLHDDYAGRPRIVEIGPKGREGS